MKTEAARETLFDLECPAVMDGISPIFVHVEIAQLQESPAA